MKRKDPNSTEKLAALVMTLKVEVNGELVPLVTREEAKKMTADQVASLIHLDHDPIPFAIARDLGMTPEEYNHPTNLTPRPIMEHRIKTATRDVPTIAKGNRISAAHEDFKRRVLAKVTGEATEEAPKRKATFPGSRQSQFKKKINGRVERR